MSCSFDVRTSISVCINCMKPLISLCPQVCLRILAGYASHLKQLSEAYWQGVGRHD